MAYKLTIGLFVAGFLGIAFIITGGVLIKKFPGIINSLIDDKIVLGPGSDSYDMWQDPTAPIYFQVWMFNITNPDDVLKGGKPNVVQMGPYSYREKREKFNISFTQNDTVFYKESRTFFFDRKMSFGPESDSFFTLNIPMLTIMDMLRYKSSIMKLGVEAAFSLYKEKYFMNITVSDLMWGYDDPILDIAKKFLPSSNLPAKFGLFYGQNGTDDGIYEIYTGKGDLSKFGEIASWNGQHKLNFWTSELANKINGTDGTIYAPHIDTNKTKYLFSSDLCRSLGMDFTKGVSKMGISLDRFVAPKIMFGNITINPYNAGFCTPAGNCLPSGLLNASVCREGAPIVMSMPHFLGCDKDVIDSVNGLHPRMEEHQSFIDIEPMTGVVMNAGKRLQINIYIDSIDGFSTTKDLKPMFMPLMWLNESGSIDQKDADQFKSEVLGKIKLTEAVKFGLIAVGGFMLLIVIVIASRRAYARRNEGGQTLSINTSDDKAPILHNGNVIS